jgi:hypothetical protein
MTFRSCTERWRLTRVARGSTTPAVVGLYNIDHGTLDPSRMLLVKGMTARVGELPSDPEAIFSEAEPGATKFIAFSPCATAIGRARGCLISRADQPPTSRIKKESPGHSLEPGILGHGRPWENRSAGRTGRERSDPLQGSFVRRPGFRWCVISRVAFTTISEMRLSHTRGAAAFGAPNYGVG